MKARTFWYEGSSKVWIRERFSESFGLAMKVIIRILLSSLPDAVGLDSTFHPVPREAFRVMAKTENIQVGLSISLSFLSGGAGVNNNDGIRVKSSIF